MSTSKTFRLFISSTFGDFRREREVLQIKIFPYIRTYCSQLGFSFQPIDLRWGVSAEAQLDQKTLDLCLEEVSACKTYPHPNFLIMAGDRYGWVPLPYAIEEHEYETLLSLMGADEQTSVNVWYKPDRNQIPASYILKERTDEYVDYDAWASVENSLRTILQTAVNASALTEDQKRKYFLSATEAEVEEGIIPYLNETEKQRKLLENHPELKEIDPQHIFGFFRDIDKSTQIEKKFIENDQDYEKAQAFKGRVRSILPSLNILHAQTNQLDSESLNDIYLSDFEAKVISFLESQIDALVEKESENTFTSLDIETEAQRYFAEQKRQGFLKTKPLEELLNTISTYIADMSPSSPLIIYGPSGRGKSSFMAQAIQSAKSKPIYRFVGATPHSGSSTEILTSLFDELGIDVRSEDDQETFEQFSYRIHDQIMQLKDITIFIDAVDQLSNDDQFLWLPRTLPSNVKIIISALDDVSYPDDSKYFKTLQQKTTNLHEIQEFNDPITLLRNILVNEQRTLQEHQENYFLVQFHSSPSPLYITIAAQEMKHWKSNDSVAEGKNPKDADGKFQSLASTQKGIIQEFITNLTKLHHHDERFVHKVLGYLYASRDGLSESELLQLISTDEAFIASMAPEMYHENLTKELPIVHWSRLHTQLKPFLRLKHQDNEELMYFFHREFEDSIKSLLTQKDEHKAIIEATQKLISQYQYEPFDSNRWGKLYATLITEYELRFYTREEQKQNYELKSTQKRFARFVAELENEKWIDVFTKQVNRIAIEHSDHNRMYEAIVFYEIILSAAEELYKNNEEHWANKYSIALTNLASMYSKLNRINMALELLERCLCIEESLYDFDPDHNFGGYTTALIYLANFYQDLNRFDEAIQLKEKSLGIIEVYYEDKPIRNVKKYVKAMTKLAEAYSFQYRTKEENKLLVKSLQIIEELYASNPDRWRRDYALAINNLAKSYNNQNRLEESIELAEKCFVIFEELYISKQANKFDDKSKVATYAWAHANLARLYRENNRFNDAIELDKKSVQIREALYVQNPDKNVEGYIWAINDLALSYEKQSRTDEAIQLYTKALKILEGLYVVTPEYWRDDYTSTLNTLGSSYEKLKEFAKASEVFKTYFKIYDFSHSEAIDDFIDPFIKWYQCEERLKNELVLVELENLAYDLKALYRQNLGDDYEVSLNEEHDGYIEIRDSEDPMDREKYKIFVKIFPEMEKKIH